MTDKRLLDPIIDSGLSDKEARVYLALLKLGQSTPGTISAEAGVKRPTTYLILEQLRERGYVAKLTQANQERYRATNPASLLKEFDQKRNRLDSILPELMALGQSKGALPSVRLLTGPNAVIEILEESLQAKSKLVQGWLQYGLGEDSLDKDFLPTYVARRIKKRVMLRGIAPLEGVKSVSSPVSKAELREVYTVPAKMFPVDGELLLWDGIVALLLFDESIGLTIESPALANTLRGIFEFSFMYAKQLATA